MRESGFDPTDRFGPFGADVTRYAPVCLNTLLYRWSWTSPRSTSALGRQRCGRHARSAPRSAATRIEPVLWDETAGLYFDYDFARGSRRRYPFATTFWPLWAGLAVARAGARRVRDNLPPLRAARAAIVTSTRVTGAQWDAPFGWAPLQLFAVAGPAPLRLRRRRRPRRARLAVDAGRGLRAPRHAGREVRRRAAHAPTSPARLAFGYTSNEVGFGWTNGVALELLADLRASGSRVSARR